MGKEACVVPLGLGQPIDFLITSKTALYKNLEWGQSELSLDWVEVPQYCQSCLSKLEEQSEQCYNSEVGQVGGDLQNKKAGYSMKLVL